MEEIQNNPINTSIQQAQNITPETIQQTKKKSNTPLIVIIVALLSIAIGAILGELHNRYTHKCPETNCNCTHCNCTKEEQSKTECDCKKNTTKESTDNKEEAINPNKTINLEEIAGYGTIEKQYETYDDSIDIVAYYKDGTVKKIYTFDTDYLKDVVKEENVRYVTQNISIDYADNKLYIQIDKKLYYIDLTKEKYELTDLGVDLERNANRIYVVDNKIYLETDDILLSSNLSKVYDINTKTLTDLSTILPEATTFVIDKRNKIIVFTDKYYQYPETGINQTLYYAPLSNMDEKVIIQSSSFGNIDIVGFYNNKIVYHYAKTRRSNDYAIYNPSNKSTEDINLGEMQGHEHLYSYNNSLYYTKKTDTFDENKTLINRSTKIYNYENQREVCTYPYDVYLLYIGNGLYQIRTSKKENNIVVNSNLEEQDLYIIDESNNKEKLEVTKYDFIEYEYVDIN